MAVSNDPKEITQRAEVEDRHKWQLADIYASDQEWEEDFEKARQALGEMKKYAGKLAGSADTLFECLEARTELAKLISKLYQYAQLNRDINNRQSQYQAMTERAAMLVAETNAALSFIEPELMKISDEDLLKLSARFPQTDIYDFYIRELIRSREHIRSEEIEELLSLSMMVAKGPETIFSLLDDADIKYPDVKDESGRTVALTKQRFAKFMDSTDRRVRRDASNAFYSAYKDHINSIGAALSTEVNKNLFYARARRYESSLHSSLDGDNIPTSVYHSLIDTTEAHLEGLHKWTRLRKKILGLDQIAPFDMLCPLFPDKDFEVPYDRAVGETLEALAPLGEKYTSMLKTAFESRWVDVFETEGKTSGAYSWGTYSIHPFVLMNYNDTVDNMFTLAHEMGHAMHTHLANSAQPFPKAGYSLFVAEVASTVNESLLLSRLIQKATDKEEKLYLLNRHIDNTMGAFFHQVMYAHFELQIHQHVEKGGALAPDMLNELWANLTTKYYGPDLTLDEYSPYKWSRIPHFYRDFYVYQYATSYAAAQALMDKVSRSEPGIIDSYLELLRSGGKDYPIALLQACGVDMTTPAPVEATLRLFSEQVDQVERLTG